MSIKSQPQRPKQHQSSSPHITNVTIQAALFSALSTILAQIITAYQQQSKSSLKTPSTLDWIQKSFDPSALLAFTVIAVIMTPPNYIYQSYLEDSFPSKVPISPAKQTQRSNGVNKEKTSEERLSKSNTLAKLILDQSLGAMVNTAVFIILAGLAKGRSIDIVLNHDLREDFMPMLTASWKVWPTVTLASLVFVPFEYRMVVANVVGVCWGVYVTLRTM